jgi:hypothetical protein
VLEDKSAPTVTEPFGCGSWGGADAVLYGDVGLDDFVFIVGDNGCAGSVEARILRASLQRT